MRLHLKSLCLLGLLTSFALPGSAQVEKITRYDVQNADATIATLKEKASNPAVRDFLKTAKFKSERAKVTAAKIANDANTSSFKTSGILHYAVPAMSELQRLPDTYPSDGKFAGTVRVIMAQDEYEPGSFVVYPLKDFGKVEFKLSPFKAKDGTVFPADKLDLKVIKVWYQNGNGWYSYFGDTELKLCPELLLNDEDLIKVDEQKVQNYARLTEKDGKQSYFWLTPPIEFSHRATASHIGLDPFQCMRENFRDAKTLQPVTLEQGKAKQFFLTAHATKDQKPGFYSGSVNLVKNGVELASIPVTVKVLPFALPKPATYADVNKPFLVSSYGYIRFEYFLIENGGDMELAKKQYLAVLKNQVEHNQDMHMMPSRMNAYEHEFVIETVKKAGMRTDYYMGGGPLAGPNSSKLDVIHDAKMVRDYYMKHLGHTNIFFGYGDEPPATWVLSVRNFFEIYQREGLKFFIAGKDQVYFAGGFMYDFFNTAYWPEDRNAPRKWNEMNHAFVAWYATQHVGPENPAYNRRQYGLTPYLAGYSAHCNYAHHFGPYNDRTLGYKPMVLAYGCHDGVLDTIQWEGFREGVDDIRYATLMKRLALEADKNPDVGIQRLGRQALQFLTEFDLTSGDVNAARLEIINYILRLKAALHK